MSLERGVPHSDVSGGAAEKSVQPVRKPWAVPTLEVMPAASAELGGSNAPDGDETS